MQVRAGVKVQPERSLGPVDLPAFPSRYRSDLVAGYDCVLQRTSAWEIRCPNQRLRGSELPGADQRPQSTAYPQDHSTHYPVGPVPSTQYPVGLDG